MNGCPGATVPVDTRVDKASGLRVECVVSKTTWFRATQGNERQGARGKKRMEGRVSVRERDRMRRERKKGANCITDHDFI